MKVLHILTVADSLIFLQGRAGWLASRGVFSEVVTAPSTKLEAFGRTEKVLAHPIPMRRAVSPFSDLRSLLSLISLIRDRRPDVVHAHTPKGGLLGMLAAWIARVPKRIYHIHGLPFETASGLKRSLLKTSEMVACMTATHVLAVSPSILRVAHNEGVCPPDKGEVLGRGSINGVSLEKFSGARVEVATSILRGRLGLSSNVPVIGFVGRLTHDKGIEVLAAAWASLRVTHPQAQLLLVGDWEDGDPVDMGVRQALTSDPRVHLTGFLEDPAPAYALMSVLAFPSLREGFGLAALEASAMKLPVVASNIAGLQDAVDDGVTGILVPPNSPDHLHAALARYLDRVDLAVLHGQQGYERARNLFAPEAIWEATLQLYVR